MGRPRLSTTQRGLGGPHQTARAKALNELQDGDPCFRCQLSGVYHPMYRVFVYYVNGQPRSQVLELDHHPGRAFGGPQTTGLSFAGCNRSHGGQVAQAVRPRRPSQYTRW